VSWALAELSDVAEIFNGKTPSKSEQRDIGAPVLKIKDVSEGGFFKGLFDSFVDQDLADKFSHKSIQLDDTLILNAAHNSDYVGKKQYRAELEVVGSLPTGEWLIARANKKFLNPRFLNYWLASGDARFKIKQLVKGIHLYPKDVARLEIPLPPLAEQKRIAAVLDKADAIRRKRQQAIQLAEEFLRAVFLDMFGDPVTKGWGLTTVENMAIDKKGSMRTGPFGSDLKHSEFVDEGVAVLGIDNAVKNRFAWDKKRYIPHDKYEQLKRYTVKPGDVLITIMGTCGRCAVVPEDIPTAINTKHLCCITLDKGKCLPSFLHAYFLMHPISRRYLGQTAKGAIMDGLNMGMIKDMPIPKVPIHIQDRYEKICDKTLANIRLQETSSVAVDEGFKSLSHQAFSGCL
jgi:type I restriction enzyme S subunit